MMPSTPTQKNSNVLLTQLINGGHLDLPRAEALFVESQKTRVPLPSLLLAQKDINARALTLAFSKEFGLPWMNLDWFDIKHAPTGIISEALIQKHKVLPLSQKGKKLSIAVSDPSHTHALDDIKFNTNMIVDPILVEADLLMPLVERYLTMNDQMGTAAMNSYGDEEGGISLDSLDIVEEREESDASLQDSTEDSPMVKLVNKIIIDAIKKGASDLHFEPFEDEVRVRFRMDGILKTVVKVPIKAYARMSSRIKVMAQTF